MTAIPAEFHALDPYLEKWAIDNYAERLKVRLSSTIEELTELHDAVLPHMKSVILALDEYPLDDMPEELKPYGHLVLTVAAYDLAVNRYKEVDVPYSYPLERVEFPHSTAEWD
ncbi:MAG: hypothetical protein J4A00_04330 [Gammaproteobacteria bacterium]|nr:hypothetical protein [Gammaproteobacteria bacterium]